MSVLQGPESHYVVGELRRHVALLRPVPGPGEQVALAAVPGNGGLHDAQRQSTSRPACVKLCVSGAFM